MPQQDTKVVIVGAGAAGITAAIGLARRGISVVVVEGGVYPGAENWSGAVYFTENLVRPEILGEDGLDQTPIERRIVQRGLLMSDGRVAVGGSVRSEPAFTQCHTVLRPVFDHDLAQKARLFGAEILTGTTVLALIRDGDHVQGVLTDRGPIYSDVVFLAEGDASNLVGREGLETVKPGDDGLARPEFLQGIKEVLELPAGEIERRFGVGEGEGAAFEILLRNGTVGGAEIPLNAGAFLYTNRESLSVGIVAPLENLTQVGVPHNRLMEWLKGMPALQELLADARPVSFGTKLIRGGGWKEMPRLAMDGCAVGGAASGIGVDFPCPNYTGPATYMGWAFSEAVAQIIEENEAFSAAALESHYVRRVQESSYLEDVHALKEWPAFVSESRAFFGTQVDVVTRTADAATAKDGGTLPAIRAAFGAMGAERAALMRESRRAGRALGLWRGVGRDLPLALFWWTANLVVGWVPRRTPTRAEFIPHFWTAEPEGRKPMPALWRYTRWIMAPGMAEALHHLYRNDGTRLPDKIRAMRRALLFRLSWLDFVLLPIGLVLARGVALLGKAPEAAEAPALDQIEDAIDHDTKLAWITYRSDEHTHIHYHTAYDENGLPDDAGSPLFNVCPAKVYKDERDRAGNVAVAVLHENCIRCETCWRADDRRVDWGRARGQRLVFETYTPADAWLRESREAAGLADADRRYGSSEADAAASVADTESTTESDEGAAAASDSDPASPSPVELSQQGRADAEAGLMRTARHGRTFRALMRHLPSVLSGSDQGLLDAVGLEVLAGARQIAGAAAGVADKALAGRASAIIEWARLASPHLEAKRFFQFEADVELLFVHHLSLFQELTGLPVPPAPAADDSVAGARRVALRAFLEQRLDRETIEACETELGPNDIARQTLFELVAALRDPETSAPVLPGSTARDAAFEELARLSPSLALVLAGHLAACDLIFRPGVASDPPSALSEVREDLSTGRALAGILRGSFWLDDEGAISGQSAASLLGGTSVLLMPTGEGFCLLVPGDREVDARIFGGLGLRGAGPGRVVLDRARPRAFFTGESGTSWLRVRAGWDLVAVARGMIGYLAERALDHADSRVQFPGMFQGFRGRDAIAKFGAVQDMLAGIVEAREAVEGLRGRRGSGRFAAALAMDLLAPSPRSVAYLAGQVLGGTAFSEEDPVSRMYRDASMLTRLPIQVSEAWDEVGERALATLTPGDARLPDLDLELRLVEPPAAASRLLTEPYADVIDAVRQVTTVLGAQTEDGRLALTRDLGRLCLSVVGLRALADRVDGRLAAGDRDGVAVEALVGVAARVASRARRLAERAGDADALCALGARLLEDGATDGACGATGALYAEHLEDGGTFSSGDLIRSIGGGSALPLTPELIEADPYLCTLQQAIEATWRERYRDRQFAGFPYTRHVEHEHHVPFQDIRWLLDEGYFRMVIPEEQGGQGKKKVAYYIAMVEMMRHGDPTQAIIVMGSTSIGTTPILLGLNDDLPELERTMEGLFDSKAVLDQVAAGDRARLTEVQHLLKSKAIRGLLPRDLKDWESIARAEQESIEQRRDAHEFFLRLISNGAISAFALTEPSAGSDTARIRTHSELVTVGVDRDERGFWTFRPEGAPEGTRRTLFTRDAFEFDGDEGMRFVRADRHRAPVELRHFDPDADARSAAAGKYRFVDLDGERVDIDDIGRVEEIGGKNVYRYYRTNGTKMWITNGSTAGVMILYARTPRGPSGLMLDAHAEGLVVGKDEDKMGQRGSATNELALNDVRIPVDQLIGIEGRGQENALETLNVGRAGLAVSCGGLMHEVVADLRRGFEEREEEPTRAELLELGRVAIDLAASESLGWQLVGRFDHPGTRSVRLESALAKAFNTEAYHRVLTRAERLLDAGFTLDLEEMEKRRRDARVLTIYEGTSEIQRFLLLRDLISGVDSESVLPVSEGVASGAFERARDALLGRVGVVRDSLGARAAQEAWLQPVVFPLVEALMSLGALSALARRVEVAQRLTAGIDGGERRVGYLREAADLLGRDLERLDVTTLAGQEAAMSRLEAGRDTHARTLADRALLQAAEEIDPAPARPVSSIGEVPVRVAVVIDPRPVVAPRPRVRGGVLREHAAELGDADRGVLAEILRLREGGVVDITVVGAGRIATIDVLEETIALGADRAFLVNTGTRNLLANDVAGAIADLLRTREELEEASFDLVVGPRDRDALMLPLARRLGLPPIERVSAIGVVKGAGGPSLDLRRGDEAPLRLTGAHVLTMVASTTAAELTWTTDGWRRARHEPVPVIDFIPEDALEIALSAASMEGAATTQDSTGPVTVDEAARRFADEVGLGAVMEAGGPFMGAIDQVKASAFLDGLGALAVTEADGDGGCPSGIAAIVRAANPIAAARKAPLGVLVIVASQDEDVVRRTAGEARAACPGARVGLLAWEDLASRSVLTRAWLIEGLLKQRDLPAFFSPEVRPAALLAGEGRAESGDDVVLVDSVDEVSVRHDSCALSGLRFDRRIRFTIDGNGSVPHAVVTADVQAPAPNADRVRPDETIVWLDEVPVPDAEDALAHAVASAERVLGVSLTDAEFIIDVGYGVGSRDGIEEVIEPLKAALEALGVSDVTIGATRKVTQDLGILPDSCQIGQTGVPVNPKVMLAVGVSGAPQHLEYIGGRAVIFAFNKDPDAPLMALNRTRPRPLVFPIVGDLFQEVPRFVKTLEARASRGAAQGG